VKVSKRPDGSRVASRVYVVSVFALAGVSAAALLTGNGRDAAIGGACIAAVIVRPLAGFLAAAIAALLGAWTIAILALITALTVKARSLAARIPPRQRPPARDALVELLDEAPADLLYATRVAAASAPLSTWHIVSLAKLADSDRWAGLLGKDPGEGAWDGPLLELDKGRRATLFFAEAVGLGLEIARRRQRPLDANLLALAAAAIPLSSASEWNADIERSTDRVLGVALIELVETLSTFSATEAGRDVLRRAELARWGEDRRMEREFVFKVGAARLPRLAMGFFT
jgi:hypothetical protein